MNATNEHDTASLNDSYRLGWWIGGHEDWGQRWQFEIRNCQTTDTNPRLHLIHAWQGLCARRESERAS